MHWHIQTTQGGICHVPGGVDVECIAGPRALARDRLLDAVGAHRLAHGERGRWTGKATRLTADAYQITPSSCVVTLVERPGESCAGYQ